MSELFLHLVKKTKALSRDFGEEKLLLILRASQTLPVLLFTIVCYFVCGVTYCKAYVFFGKDL